MFAELPGREGHLSFCGGCLDSRYICTYPPFHCECPFTVFHKMHRKPQDGNGRVSRLLASLPLIHAGYPFINVRVHKREEYLQAIFKVSYFGSKRSDDLKVHVCRHKLRRIFSHSWMYLPLQCLTLSTTYNPYLQLRQKMRSIEFQLILGPLGCLCKSSKHRTNRVIGEKTNSV